MTTATAAALQFGPIVGADDHPSGPCLLCRKHVDRSFVGVVTPEAADLVCEDCSHKHEPGLWQLAEGLGQIDTALSIADPERRAVLGTTALNVLIDLAKAHAAQEQGKS